MTACSFYDSRATPLVNHIANGAINIRNACLREDPSFLIDMRKAVGWSVDAVVPRLDPTVKDELAERVSDVIQQALVLDRMVVGCRGNAA